MQLYIDHIFKLHDLPLAINRDCDSIFLSNFWKELFQLQGVELRFSLAYHPQFDGQIEVVNRYLECYLHCMCNQQPHHWHQWRPLTKWWYNTTYYSATKMMPFQALHGYPPLLHVPYFLRDFVVATANEVLMEKEWILTNLKTNLHRAQDHMRCYVNK